jgi:hypothetical protein
MAMNASSTDRQWSLFLELHMRLSCSDLSVWRIRRLPRIGVDASAAARRGSQALRGLFAHERSNEWMQ